MENIVSKVNEYLKIDESFIKNALEEYEFPICIISWKRIDRLKKSLTNLLNTSKIDIVPHIVMYEYSAKEIEEIKEICKHFSCYYFYIEEENKGTAFGRKLVSDYIYKEFGDLPYMGFMDDDIIVPELGWESLLSYIRTNPKISAMNCWVNPSSSIWDFNEKGELFSSQPKNIINPTVTLGAAIMICNTEVFETCMWDDEYFIGCVDLDFGLQMYKEGWDMFTLAHPKIKGENLKGGSTEYVQQRYNKEIINQSVQRFKNKWGYNL